MCMLCGVTLAFVNIRRLTVDPVCRKSGLVVTFALWALRVMQDSCRNLDQSVLKWSDLHLSDSWIIRYSRPTRLAPFFLRASRTCVCMRCRCNALPLASSNSTFQLSPSAATCARITMSRGAFIVFEGADRSGKTTQTKRVSQALESANIAVAAGTPWRFPDRTTNIGRTIDGYLSKGTTLDNRAVHLLFAANRWERAEEIWAALRCGETVIVDRYAYSGVCYSVAKGLDMEWCRGADSGLPKPDLVVYLDLGVERAKERGGWGQERYEKEEFQRRVGEVFERLRGGEWRVVDADADEDVVFERIMDVVLPVIKGERGEIGKLWE